jgi:16S rRNA (guanine527-N7)-methyltransferase
MPGSPLEADRLQALALTPVSRETLARLDRFAAILVKWQESTNLIAPSTVHRLWTRHIADSLQLIDFAPEAKTWVDLGSGGGFPGVPIACALGKGKPSGGAVHLVESNGKKAAFLREAVRVVEAPAIIHALRIDQFVSGFKEHVDVVTARALAPLKRLFDECYGLIRDGALGLFLKGQDVGVELTEASRYWRVDSKLFPSRTDPKGRIVAISALERRKQALN